MSNSYFGAAKYNSVWRNCTRVQIVTGYEAGREYEHGGLSPQECVVPILTITRAAPAEEPITIESVSWRRLRCNVVVKGAKPGLRVDLRTKVGDPATSLVEGGKELGGDGTAALFVEDEDREGEGAVAVVIGAGARGESGRP